MGGLRWIAIGCAAAALTACHADTPPPAVARPPETGHVLAADPPRDAAHPARTEAVWIPSGGALMNGVMFAASGAGPHPTALLLHGLPGNEQNLDLAQALRRAGYNVLTLHYRGSWGSPGAFTLSGCVDDGDAALAFLLQPETLARYQVDPRRVVLVGHSFGGFIASRVAASHPSLAATVLLAPWDPAADLPQLHVPEKDLPVVARQAFDDVDGRTGGYTALDMAREILSARRDWKLESVATSLGAMPILLVTARHDSADDLGTGLATALRALPSTHLATLDLDSDHSFSDHRLALEAGVLDWLQRTIPATDHAGEATR